MARGKIIYTPIITAALSLDGAHYLSLAEAAFNMATGDFGVDFLGQIQADTPDNEVLICGKGVDGLAGAAGWLIYALRDTGQLRLKINDGQASPLVIDSQAAAFTLGARFWGRADLDRDGQVRFYVAGLDVGGGVISSRAGSLNNSQPLRVGGGAVATNRFKGVLDFIRFDQGRSLPAAWHSEEWDRIRYGFSRDDLQDFLARWQFAQSLLDDSAEEYGLTYNGGGSPPYVDGWPYAAAPLEVIFDHNYEYGFRLGHVDTDDLARTIDATLGGYGGGRKRTYFLPFNAIEHPQVTALRAAWAAGGPLDFYLDAAKPRTCYGRIMAPPEFTEIFMNAYEGEVEIQEI